MSLVIFYILITHGNSNILNMLCETKRIIEINFTFFQYFFNRATRKLNIIYVTCICGLPYILLGSSALVDVNFVYPLSSFDPKTMHINCKVKVQTLQKMQTLTKPLKVVLNFSDHMSVQDSAKFDQWIIKGEKPTRILIQRK